MDSDWPADSPPSNYTGPAAPTLVLIPDLLLVVVRFQGVWNSTFCLAGVTFMLGDLEFSLSFRDFFFFFDDSLFSLFAFWIWLNKYKISFFSFAPIRFYKNCDLQKDFECDRIGLSFFWKYVDEAAQYDWACVCVFLSLCTIVMLNFFGERNGFTQLLILSIHPLPGAYLRLCCFFPQAAS